MIASGGDVVLRIQGAATPLGERLRRPAPQEGAAAADPFLAASRLETWKKVAANGDAAAFSRRLGWDALDPGSLPAALAPAEEVEGEPPSWVETLRAACGGTPAEAALSFAAAGDPDRSRVPEAELPFEGLFLPLVRLARDRAARRAGDAYAGLEPAAHAALEHALLRRLASVCSRALFAELEGFRARREGVSALFGGAPAAGLFEAFMADMRGGGWLGFLERYPVAARLCATVVELWVETVAEFLERLAADAPELEAAFAGGAALGRVVAVEANLSDPHLGGRSVLIARFAAGPRIVYKPRPVGLERLHGEIVEWVNRHRGLHPLRRLAIVVRPTHGWIEHAGERECEDAEAVGRYFERCGMLLCLAHVLGGSDFHFENLVAAGEDPVLIDMEGLVAHRFPLLDELAVSTMPAAEAGRRVLRSVLNTRLLPTWKLSGEGRAADVGGLSRAAGPVEVEASGWADVNRDAMRLVRRRFTHQPRQHNLPRLGGAQASARDHVGRIVEGYRHTYRLLLARREEWLGAGGLLDGARAHRVRFILRPTSLYAALLERCLHPRHLRSGIDRGIELDALSRTLLRSAERPAAWPLLRAEREALERLDVPYFDAEAGSTTLELPTGEAVPGCFSASALDEVAARLRGLSGADLDFQAAAIRTSFDTLDAHGLRVPEAACPAPRAPRGRGGDLLGAAERIADAVLARAHRAPDGGLSWVGVAYLARARRHAVAPATLGLADGYTGIALFLAALAAHTGKARYRAAATAALRPLCGRLDELERAARLRRSPDVGGGTGLGSAVYALARIGGLLGDAGVLAAAHRVADCITPRAVAEDGAWDVVSGSAGTLLGLLALHGASGREELLERALACGHHLLAGRSVDAETGAAVWATAHGAETGLAHGQAGIACALRRLAAVRPEGGLLQAAAEAEAFELHRLGAGLEGTAAANRAAAWSHGAAGIGLARLEGLGEGEAPPPEVEAAIRLTRASLLDGSDDAACGVAGRVDFLLHAGLALGRPGVVAAAREGAASLAAAAPRFRMAWRHGNFDAGFHLGLSGIGYQLLRVLDPARFPSVLLWR